MSGPPCCTEILRGTAGESPFSRIIGLGYYDGLLSGFAQCGRCGNEFSFDCLEDQGGESLRIFCFRRIAAGGMDRLVKNLSRHLEPRWPVWIPVWSFPSVDIEQQLSGEVRALEATAGGERRVIAWDLERHQILAARDYPSAPPPDWIVYCGLRRNPDPE